MDWTDTIMLEREIPMNKISAGHSAVSAKVISTQGVSLLQSGAKTFQETASALEMLSGVRTVGRRVVVCDTSQVAFGRQLGSELVALGRAHLLVSCGISGREVAIGARDAGLSLANVVVCGNLAGATEVLGSRVIPGDTVLLLGIDQRGFDNIVIALERYLSTRLAAAA
jgi:hypothetical protein